VHEYKALQTISTSSLSRGNVTELRLCARSSMLNSIPKMGFTLNT
jgi:hypothetical protein